MVIFVQNGAINGIFGVYAPKTALKIFQKDTIKGIIGEFDLNQVNK